MAARLESTRAEPGCLEYVVAADPANPARAVLLEKWESEEALGGHAQALKANPPASDRYEHPALRRQWRAPLDVIRVWATRGPRLARFGSSAYRHRQRARARREERSTRVTPYPLHPGMIRLHPSGRSPSA